MKRWLIIMTCVVAVLAVVAPGLIGRLVDAELAAADGASSAALGIQTLSVEKGWFRSTSRHRVTLLDDDLAAVARMLQPALPAYTPPILIVDARIAHGPLPLAALDETGVSARPAFAAAAVRVDLPNQDGASRPLPGVLGVRLGLSGGFSVRYRMPVRVSLTPGPAWQAAELAFGSAAGGGDLNLAVTVDRLRWRAIRVATLQAQLGSARDGKRTDAALSAKLGSVQAGRHTFDARARIALAAVDTAAAAQLAALWRQPDDVVSTQVIEATRDRALRRLLAAGGKLHVQEFLLATPYGDIDATATVALRALDDGAAWRELAGAADGHLRLSLPAALLAVGSPYRTQLLPLVAGGYLAADGDRYRLQAGIEHGALTVNGAPLAYAFD